MDCAVIPERMLMTSAELAAYLLDGLEQPLSLIITRNRVSLIRLRRLPNGGIELRTHACLLEAPPETLRALKRFLLTRRRADWRTVCAFLQQAPRPSRPPRPDRLVTAGQAHDLKALLDEVNAAHFPGPCPCSITWGRAGTRPRGRLRRHIAYGSYHREASLIRIHPLLDTPRVPREFVAFIIYHERLHAALGAENRGLRQYHHTAAFRKLERLFPDYERLSQTARTLFLTLDPPAPRRLWHPVFPFR
ncbi:MAG: hypothetical protein R6X19_06560 [Kiritimatiellia bacterium]